MPAKNRPSSWRKFWRDWGLYLAILLVLITVGVVAGVLSCRTSPEIATGRPYRIYFTQSDFGSPAPDGLEAEILKDIAAARESVDVVTPGLDLSKLAGGLVQARERGVTVRVLENAPAAEDTAVVSVTAFLESHGVTVTLHPPEGGLGETFVVVDQQVVWAGSWGLSQEGLTQDVAYVLRWDLAPLAQDFHREFVEMVEQKAFGPGSPVGTVNRFIAVPDISSIGVFMTPEDDPLSEILSRMFKSQYEMVVMTEVLNDPRIEARLIAQAPLSSMHVWGIVSQAQNLTKNLEQLLRLGVQIPPYAGPGRMRENAIMLDGKVTIIFSQRLVQERLDEYDGYILVVADEDLTQVMGQEFRRLFELSQPTPVPLPTPTSEP